MADENDKNNENGVQDPLNVIINEQNTDVQSVAELNLNTVFSLLHNKAVELAKSAAGNIEIVNSAINDKGNFLGAGLHVVIAQPTSGELVKSDCYNAIKTYFTWFCGPDVAKELNEDSLVPLARPISDEEKAEKVKDRQDKVENNSKEKAAEKNESIINEINTTLLRYLFESTQEQDEEEAKAAGNKITGYQAQYQLDIIGLEPSPFKLALENLKKSFSDFIGDIEIKHWDWRSGAEKEGKKIEDIANEVKGNIPMTVAASAINNAIKKKLPGTTAQATVLDTKSIINHLSKLKRLPSADKGTLTKFDNAVCIKIDKNDKNYENINKKMIADIVQTGINSKETKVSTNIKIGLGDVILINNYNDEHYDPKAEAHGKSKPPATKAAAADDTKLNEHLTKTLDLYNLIFENDNEITNYKNSLIHIINDLLNEDNEDDKSKAKDENNDKAKDGESESDATEVTPELLSTIAKELRLAYTKLDLANDENNALLKQVSDKSKEPLEAAIASLLVTTKNEKGITSKSLSNRIEDVNDADVLNLAKDVNGFIEKLLADGKTNDKGDKKIENLKRRIMPIKYRYIKYDIPALIEKGYLKLDKKIEFDMPKNKVELEKIAKTRFEDLVSKVSGYFVFKVSDYDTLNKIIPLTDAELDLFNGMNKKQITDIRDSVVQKAGSPVMLAKQKLSVELSELIKDIKDDKLVAQMIPGVKSKDDLEKQIGDLDSNIWNKGVEFILDTIDDIKAKAIDREGNKASLDKGKTQFDMYIIPIKNIVSDTKASTK